MRIGWILTVSICLATNILAQSQKVKESVKSEFQFTDLSNLKLHGYLGNMMDLNFEHGVKEQNVEQLVDIFKYRTEDRKWQSEFWGKWITGAIQAYQYYKDEELLNSIHKAVEGLISTQTPDGYIGNYADDKHLHQWDIWGRKYCLLGLIAYYDMNPQKNGKALKAAEKLSDHLLTEVGSDKANIVIQGNYRGLAATSILEPIVQLYKRTGNKNYLNFAKYIIQQWETPEGPQLISKGIENVPVYKRFPYDPNDRWTTNGQKAYEMMSCYEGLLELYTLEGNPEWLKAVENTANSIIQNEINIVGSGSSSECWFHGKKYQTEDVIHFNEVCVTTTWIKLCTKLFMITGKPLYADQIETSMYNALIGGVTPDGHTFTKYPPLEGRKELSGGQCGMELNCCGANGPRALTLYPKLIYTQNHQGVFVNFFEDSETTVTSPTGNKVTLKQTGNYPIGDLVTIEVLPEVEETFTIGVRLPGWSRISLLKVNDLAYEDGGGMHQRLIRKWKKGDKITVKLDMRGMVITEGRNFAIRRGPLVLARDARFEDGCVGETAFRPASDGGFIDLEVNEDKPEGMYLSVSAKIILGANTEREYYEPKVIKLTNYASAGNTWDDESRFKIWFEEPLSAKHMIMSKEQ